MPGFADITRAGVVGLCASRANSTPDAPFAPRISSGHPDSARAARTLSTRGAPTPRLPRLRDAFHPPVLSVRSSLALRATLQTTVSTRALPPGPDVRHAFTHSACVLDTPRSGYSPLRDEPHAACRLLQLKRSSNTLTGAPNLGHRWQATICRVTPPLARWRQPS
jgi:hypothetical protein